MRLLCADDEDDIRLILELALSLDPDFTVEIVPSGTALLERARTGTFDGILIDAMMPDLDGYETCRRLKADPRTASIPVIFLTAKTREEDKQRALNAGAIAAFEKPFDPLTLAADVRATLQQ